MSRNRLSLLAIGTLAAAACSEGGAGPDGTGQVILQLATTPKTANAPAASPADALTITKVQLVARKIRLAQAADACPQSEPAGSSDDQGGECPVVKAGPLLLDPPVTEGAVSAFTADLPPGTYNRLRMQIHKPTGSNDQAFLQTNPEFDGVSIKVTGDYNGAAFTFTTALTSVQEIAFATPVEVVEGTPVEVTVMLDVKSWFATQGGGFINPATLTQQQRSQIEQAIRGSFRAFKDQNKDGKEG